MDISQKVIERLEQLVTKGPKQAEAVLFDLDQEQGYIVGVPVEEDNLGIALTLQGYDRYSVILHNLEMNYPHTARGNHKNQNLRAYAEEIIERLSYLEEPLALVELDRAEGIAQLRSNPPRAEKDQSTYWEVLVRSKPYLQVSLARYQWTPDHPERTRVAYPATFATLGRIAQDLAECLSENVK